MVESCSGACGETFGPRLTASGRHQANNTAPTNVTDATSKAKTSTCSSQRPSIWSLLQAYDRKDGKEKRWIVKTSTEDMTESKDMKHRPANPGTREVQYVPHERQLTREGLSSSQCALTLPPRLHVSSTTFTDGRHAFPPADTQTST